MQLPSIFAEPEEGLVWTRPKYTALRPLGQSPQAPFSQISVAYGLCCRLHFFRKASSLYINLVPPFHDFLEANMLVTGMLLIDS